jgi:hypothetical protein
VGVLVRVPLVGAGTLQAVRRGRLVSLRRQHLISTMIYSAGYY